MANRSYAASGAAKRSSIVSAPPVSSWTSKPWRGIEVASPVLGLDAQAEGSFPRDIGAGDDGAEQQPAHALTAKLGVHRDRELGDVGGHEAEAGVGCVEVSEPRRADRFIAPVECEDGEVAGPAPGRDVTRVLRIGEQGIERRALLCTFVAPIRRFVEHFGEERGVGARAQAEHAPEPRVDRMRSRVLALVVASTLVAAACGGDDDSDSGSGSGTSSPAGTLDWDDCGVDVECATLAVPLDYAEPDGETIDLALARRLASGDRIGSLLVNVGGPGAPGVPVIENADAYVTPELLERFDLVAWDPRGVGLSAEIDCGDNFDSFYAVDHSPDDEAEVEENFAASRAFAEGCTERSAELLPHVSSRTTVQDMDAIRTALGEEKLSYLGFSYGTYLGALYADRYPERVRALVLDGAVDPSLTYEEVSHDQAMGFDSALDAFLDDCAANDCGFGGSDPHEAFTHADAGDRRRAAARDGRG